MPGESNLENDADQTLKTASSAREAEIMIDDGQKIASDTLAEDAEAHVEEVSDKAETSCEESNAASMVTPATKINSTEENQDEPVKETTHEMLTGSLAVEVRSMSSDVITSNVDPKSHSGNALEVNDIIRDEILDEEVWQQKILIIFVLEHISD